ncbi:hypothetical protein [Halomicronema sp. CCY15110]|nr:hypothetical protein [Halomicronema sp. CCY15110]
MRLGSLERSQGIRSGKRHGPTPAGIASPVPVALGIDPHGAASQSPRRW